MTTWMIPRRLWIRPRYRGTDLVGLCLCTTNGELTMDEQILAHFPPDEGGKFIKLEALANHWTTDIDAVQWGNGINTN